MAASSVNRLRWIFAAFSLGGLVAPPAFAQRLRVTPRASQQRPAPGTMTVATPFVFTQAPQGLVQVTSWEPGATLPIATSGGVAPITYTVTAVRNAELLEIVEAPSAAAVGRNDRIGGVGGKMPTARVLRFKGLPRQPSAGSDLRVTITAADANGSKITRDFTLEALPGRVVKLELTDGNVVRGQNTRVQATVDLLPPGATVQVEDSSDGLAGSQPGGISRLPCHFSAAFNSLPNKTGPTLKADAGGRISLSIPGRFSASNEGKTGPCSLGLVLSVTLPGAQFPKARVWALVTTNPVRISAPMAYRVDRTWSLNSKFRFAIHPPMPGSCIGASAFTGGVFPVGAFEDENGDLVIAVRSGPLGTDCKAQSSPWALPVDFRLVSIDWDLQRTGNKCCIGDACRPSGAAASEGFIVPGAIPSDDPLVYATSSDEDPLRDATKLAAGANPARQRRSVFNSMEARLTCKETASNDHGVKATLKSVTFEGPPGRTFP